MGSEVHAFDIGREDFVPGGLVGIDHGAVALDTGAVDENVDSAKSLDREAHERFDSGGVADIAGSAFDGYALGPEIRDGFIHCLLSPAAQNDRGPALGQFARGGEAHAEGSAGDNRDLAREYMVGHGIRSNSAVFSAEIVILMNEGACRRAVFLRHPSGGQPRVNTAVDPYTTTPHSEGTSFVGADRRVCPGGGPPAF